MEIIKKKLDVKDALGWYLMRDEYRTWMETVEEDDETGEPVEVERKEILCGKGTPINEISMSLLHENGVKVIEVSNVPVKGEQDKCLNLWETALKVRYKDSAKDSKRSWFVTADHPAAAEAVIAGYFELNVEAVFELVKVNKLDFNRVIKMYDTEKEEYDADGTTKVRWYKCQIYSMVDDEDSGESKSAGMSNILVQAVSFEKAITAIKAVMNRDEYTAIYNTIKLLQELTVVDVFIPEEKVSYYSNDEISDFLHLEHHKQVLKENRDILDKIEQL